MERSVHEDLNRMSEEKLNKLLQQFVGKGYILFDPWEFEERGKILSARYGQGEGLQVELSVIKEGPSRRNTKGSSYTFEVKRPLFTLEHDGLSTSEMGSVLLMQHAEANGYMRRSTGA